MIASPSLRTSATPSTRYLEDLFLHVRGCSRRATESMREFDDLEERLRKTKRGKTKSGNRGGTVLRPPFITDAAIRHENVVGDVMAAVAPAAVDQVQRLEQIAPGFKDVDLTQLGPKQVDRLVRPIFEASGILDDFMPWGERFPNYEDDGADPLHTQVR